MQKMLGLFDQSHKPIWSVNFSSWILFFDELQVFLVYLLTVFWSFNVKFPLCAPLWYLVWWVFCHLFICISLAILVFVVPDGFFFKSTFLEFEFCY
jgi:hypothetical protein